MAVSCLEHWFTVPVQTLWYVFLPIPERLYFINLLSGQDILDFLSGQRFILHQRLGKRFPIFLVLLENFFASS